MDLCLGRLLVAVEAAGGGALVTADHGNADQMYELSRDAKTGAVRIETHAAGHPLIRTSHSLNRVPFTIVDGAANEAGRRPYCIDPAIAAPRLSHVAATALWLLGFAAPEGYDPPLIRGV